MQNNKLILGLIGEMASGKTTITDHLKQKHNAVSFRFSDMLRDILDRIDVEKSRGNLQTLSTFLRTTYGEDLMSKVIAKDVAKTTSDFIIIEGIRRPSDIEYLKYITGFHLIAITADMKTRFDRITARSENPDDQGKTWETFQQEQTQEAEQEITGLMTQAETVIDNNGTVEDLFAQVDAIVERVRSKE